MPQPVIAALRIVVPRVAGRDGQDSITGAPYMIEMVAGV
jgi:hypothetical protein